MATDLKGKKLPKGIIQQANGLYRGEFNIEGERYRFSSRDLNSLKKEMEAKRYEIKNGLYRSEKRITCGEFFETWLNEYKTNVKRGTVSTYSQVYKNLLQKAFEKKQMKDMRGDYIQKHINSLVSAGHSYSRINNAMIILNGIFSQARKLHYINSNPMEAVTMPSKGVMAAKRGEKEKKINAMSREEKDVFLEYAADSKYIGYYVFSLNTGCRIGEVLALKWKDVDFQNREIHINGTLEYIRGTGRVIEVPKTKGSRRVIPMTETVYNLLKETRKQQLTNKALMGRNWKEEAGIENVVFTYPEGGAFWDTSIRVDIDKILRKAAADGKKLPAVTPHTFRHTFATLGLKAGIRPKDMQVILGHANFSITMDIYAEVLADSKRESMDIIAAIM